jgi:hypothetical protein
MTTLNNPHEDHDEIVLKSDKSPTSPQPEKEMKKAINNFHPHPPWSLLYLIAATYFD